MSGKCCHSPDESKPRRWDVIVDSSRGRPRAVNIVILHDVCSEFVTVIVTITVTVALAVDGNNLVVSV